MGGLCEGSLAVCSVRCGRRADKGRHHPSQRISRTAVPWYVVRGSLKKAMHENPNSRRSDAQGLSSCPIRHAADRVLLRPICDNDEDLGRCRWSRLLASALCAWEQFLCSVSLRSSIRATLWQKFDLLTGTLSSLHELCLTRIRQSQGTE